MSEFREEYLINLLPLYYKRIFPYAEFHKWLCYGDPKIFNKREISFTLDGDIYIRYLSFNNLEEFIKKLQDRIPIKIDIGAVYTHSPEQRRTITDQMIPIEKEIVFDIDMNDYDEIRTCCIGAEICLKCWKFMVIACKILDAALREDFGYDNILWVFSGRRGIHCWVCDDSARKIKDDEVRSAIAEYLQVIKGGHFKKRVKLSNERIHPSIQRAVQIIDNYFKDILIEQDLLKTDEQLNVLFNYIEDENIKEIIRQAVTKHTTSQDRWTAFEETFETLLHKNEIPRHLKNIKSELKLFYTYPRLDINVTKTVNHLLKSPFCVHPKTGKICVPINPKLIEKFDPNTVPTINHLINEINSYDAKTIEQEKSFMETGGGNAVGGNVDESSTPSKIVRIKDYKKTSLLKAVNLFIEFLRDLQNSRKKKLIENF